MKRALLTAVLAASSIPTAYAARHELTLQYEGASADSASVIQVSDASGFDGFGLSLGYAVLRGKDAAALYRTKRFGLVVGLAWGHASRTREAFTTAGAWSGRFSVNDIRVGAKADVDVGNVFYPFVRVEAGVVIGTNALSLSDTSSSRAPVTGVGAAPEGVFTAGFEIMMPDRKLNWPVTFSWTFEFGGRVVGPMALGDMGGAIDLSGGVFRAGMGLRY